MANDSVYLPKKRNSSVRKRNRLIFVAAEGNNKTEYNYLQSFSNRKNNRFRFVSGNSTDPVNIANELIGKMESEGFDSEYGDLAFCLIDGDVKQKKDEQISQIDIIAADKGFQVIVSNPCFEIWFLNHFNSFNTKQYKSSKEAVNELKKTIPNYEKNSKDMYDRTCDKIELAIKNSKLQEKTALENGKIFHTAEFQPATEMYKVVEELL